MKKLFYLKKLRRSMAGFGLLARLTLGRARGIGLRLMGKSLLDHFKGKDHFHPAPIPEDHVRALTTYLFKVGPQIAKLNKEFNEENPDLWEGFQSEDPIKIQDYEDSFSRILNKEGLYTDYLACTALSRLRGEGYSLLKPPCVRREAFCKDPIQCLGQLEELEFLRVYGRRKFEGESLSPTEVAEESDKNYALLKGVLEMRFEGKIDPQLRSLLVRDDSVMTAANMLNLRSGHAALWYVPQGHYLN